YINYYIRNFDYPLFFVFLFLCLFGLVMIYSSSMMVSIVYEDGTPDYFYRKQLSNLFIAGFAFLVAAFFPYKHFINKKLMMFLVFIMLVLEFWVTFFGTGKQETGSQSWIRVFGLMNFQPSEFAKLFIILYFAGAF